jgi:hypothetical protein
MYDITKLTNISAVAEESRCLELMNAPASACWGIHNIEKQIYKAKISPLQGSGVSQSLRKGHIHWQHSFLNCLMHSVKT